MLSPQPIRRRHFRLEEATIEDVHAAMEAGDLTAVDLVRSYLKRIAAYNGRCVGGDVDAETGLLLGRIEPIKHAGQLGALLTINIRGKRSLTDTIDDDPDMPDAVEVAQMLDDEYQRTKQFRG